MTWQIATLDICRLYLNRHFGYLQVILESMSKIDPPVHLDKPSNAASRDYLLTTARSPDFEYPQVKIFFFFSFKATFVANIASASPHSSFSFFIQLLFAQLLVPKSAQFFFFLLLSQKVVLENVKAKNVIIIIL